MEEILSAGIDIGTSTTQLVFSRMILQNTGGFGRIPQIKVVSKEVIYESEIYFTPLSSREEIDGCEFPYKSRVMGTSEPLKPLKAPYMARNPVKWGFFRLKGQEIPLKI